MKLNFSKTITKSGAPLWTLNLPESGTVAAGVLIKAGTRDEIWPKEAGIAHALEHMFLQGTESFPTQRFLGEYIEEVGGRLNAWTSKEMTFYYSQVPANYAKRSVHLLSEQLKKSLFPEEKIPIEMKNIVQEIHRAHDNPQGLANRLSDGLVYGNHPLGKDTLGLEESVLALTRNDFIAFKERYYNPANYVFVVAGNISQEEALELFDEYFPEEAKQKPNTRIAQELNPVAERKLIQKKDIEQVHMFLSATTGKASGEDAKHIEFFTRMISGGFSTPLFQEVRNRLGLCYEIWADETKWSDVGVFDIYIGTDPKRYKEAIDTALKVVEKHKIDEALMEKVKNMKIGRLSLLYESTMNIINLAAQDIAFTGEPKGYDQTIKEIKETNIKDIESAVDKYLKPELFFTTMLVPKDFIEEA